jgi:hypothetical protein
VPLYSAIGKSFRPVGSSTIRADGSVSGVGPVMLASAISGGTGASANSVLGKVVIGANEKAGIANSGISRGLVSPSSIAAAPASVTPASTGFGRFMQGPVGTALTSGGGLIGGLVAGVGAGISNALAARAQAKEQQRVTDSYKVGSTAYHGVPASHSGIGGEPSRPTPREKWQRPIYTATADGKIERTVSGGNPQ